MRARRRGRVQDALSHRESLDQPILGQLRTSVILVSKTRKTKLHIHHIALSANVLLGLTLPRTRLPTPRTHPEFQTTRRARSDGFFLSRRAQPPFGTCKGTRARVVALHKCATRPATAAIDSVGPVPPTKIADCIVIPRRAHLFPGHSHNKPARQGRVHKRKWSQSSINC